MTRRAFDGLFPEIFTSERVVPFVNHWEWAILEVLPILLKEMNEVEIKIASFTISEQAVREIYHYLDHRIVDLQLLVDFSNRINKIAVMAFASEVCRNLRFTNNHSKVLLVKSLTNNLCFGIIGSQNINRPKRTEVGIAFSDPEMFDFFYNEYLQLYADAVPYHA